MNRKILGLDIRNDALSAVLVRSGFKGNWIEAHQYAPISDQKDIESRIASFLETIAEKIDISGSTCVASFPADQISYRNVRIPFKSQKKIRQILPYELEPMLPFPVEDQITDFHPIKLADSNDYTDLIAASVGAAGLKSYLNTIAAFNVEPETVTVGGYPTALYLANLADVPANFLFVDLGNKKSTLFVFVSGQICLVRSLPANSADSSRTDSLCADIQRTLSASEEILHIDFQPDKMFITGSGLDAASFEKDSIEQEMERILGISVKRTDLAADADIINKDYLRQNWKPEQMDNALALAMLEIEGVKSFNFRRGPFIKKKHWVMYKPSLIKTGMLTGSVLMLFFINIMLDSYYMKKRIDRVNNQITGIFKSTFPDVKRIVEPVHQMRIKIKEAKEKYLFSGETVNNIRAIDILNDISGFIPTEIDVNLSRLVIGAGSVMISGDTDTFNAVDEVKSRLEQGIFFKKITISSTNKDKSENRVRFKLRVQL